MASVPHCPLVSQKLLDFSFLLPPPPPPIAVLWYRSTGVPLVICMYTCVDASGRAWAGLALAVWLPSGTTVGLSMSARPVSGLLGVWQLQSPPSTEDILVAGITPKIKLLSLCCHWYLGGRAAFPKSEPQAWARGRQGW